MARRRVGVKNPGGILYVANSFANGVLNVNTGGQVPANNHLWWGVSGTGTVAITGTLTQTAGILGLGTNDASTPTGGAATVTIGDGGLFALNNISGAALVISNPSPSGTLSAFRVYSATMPSWR